MTRLVLVPSALEVGHAWPERPLSLLTQPGRPGHVLTQVDAPIGPAERAALDAAADDAGVPAGLLAALHIEAVRHLELVGALGGPNADTLADVLDCLAARPSRPPLIAPPARRQLQWVAALRAGTSASHLPPGPVRLPVIVPAAAAWAIAATGRGESLGDWVLARVRAGGSKRTVAWEAAAAEAGASLGEWIQAAALRKAANRAPQALT